MIHGSVEPGFEAVEKEFRRNFAERGELGAACAIYHRGKKVVDLWGGYRDAKTHAPWEQDTLVSVMSTTKGLAAMAVALAHSRPGKRPSEMPTTGASRDWDKETSLAKEPAVYEIVIEGHLAPHRLQQFEGLEVTYQSNGETLITGPIHDQAALYGLLNWLRNLGVVLISVERLKQSG